MSRRNRSLALGALATGASLLVVGLAAGPALGVSPSPATTTNEAHDVWAWVAMGVLVLGGLIVLAAGRRWGPGAAESVGSTDALLAQYQRLATRSERTAPTDEEISYQRAVLHDLDPIAAAAAAATADPDARDGLRAVRTAAKDLRETLRAAKGTALKSHERAAVGPAAEAFGRVVLAARHPDGEDEGERA